MRFYKRYFQTLPLFAAFLLPAKGQQEKEKIAISAPCYAPPDATLAKVKEELLKRLPGLQNVGVKDLAPATVGPYAWNGELEFTNGPLCLLDYEKKEAKGVPKILIIFYGYVSRGSFGSDLASDANKIAGAIRARLSGPAGEWVWEGVRLLGPAAFKPGSKQEEIESSKVEEFMAPLCISTTIGDCTSSTKQKGKTPKKITITKEESWFDKNKKWLWIPLVVLVLPTLAYFLYPKSKKRLQKKQKKGRGPIRVFKARH